MLCGVRAFVYVGGSVGDAKNSYLSSFHLEELVGELFFKCLEYGTSMSNVVSMEGTQWLNF